MADEELQPLLVTAQQAADIARAERKINNLRGPGITNKPDSLTIAIPPAVQQVQAGSGSVTLFPVRLDTDGGVSGTNGTTPCTFTYSVLRFSAAIPGYVSADILGSHITLTGYGNGLRGLNLELAAATWGWAFYDGGTVVLLFADERPAGEQDCS